MANYKDIRGTTVRVNAGDLSGSAKGELWYDSTNANFSYKYIGAAAWATGNNTNTPAIANRGHGTQGTQTAALATGGGVPVIANVESYDGTSWTEITDLNVAKQSSVSIGTNTATLVAGGYDGSGYLQTNESWNGSAWTEVGDLNTAVGTGTGTGTATAGLAVGGTPTPTSANCQIWDGSSWTEVANLNSGRYGLNGAGTSTDGLVFAGSPEPAGVAITEKWNGSSWTEVADLNLARMQPGGAGTSSSAALAFGGLNGASYKNETEQYNGTSWTELNNLNTARFALGAAGSTTAGLAYAGSIPGGDTQATEEWAGSPVSNAVLTD